MMRMCMNYHASSPPPRHRRAGRIRRVVDGTMYCLGMGSMLDGRLSSPDSRVGGHVAVLGLSGDLPDGHLRAQRSAVVTVGGAGCPVNDTGYVSGQYMARLNLFRVPASIFGRVLLGSWFS